MSNISIVPVQTKQQLRAFIHLPETIHAAHSNWLPPLFMDERTYYNPDKNKAFSYCDTLLFMAYRGGKPMGRVMGIIHPPYNQVSGEKTVRFEHLDCFEDEAVCHALLDAVARWGKAKGMNQLVGPFGFSDKDPEGFQIEGFGEMPIMVTPCNLPYLPRFLETYGMEKKIDCLDFRIHLHTDVPAIYPEIFERLRQKNQFKVLEFANRKALKPWIVPVFELINRTYKDIYGFVPLDQQEMQEMADRYLPILDPRFVKVIPGPEPHTPIAFILGLPNMTPGIQRARGRLLPFGWWHILRAMRQSTQLDLMLGAVDSPYRGRGLDVLMGWAIMQSAMAAGYQTMESHLILETNIPMRKEFERMGAKPIKRFRVFRKMMNDQ